MLELKKAIAAMEEEQYLKHHAQSTEMRKSIAVQFQDKVSNEVKSHQRRYLMEKTLLKTKIAILEKKYANSTCSNC